MTEQAVIANNESEEPQSGFALKEIKQVIYDSRTEQVYKIWLLNLSMSIITFGIYSLGGKRGFDNISSAHFRCKAIDSNTWGPAKSYSSVS